MSLLCAAGLAPAVEGEASVGTLGLVSAMLEPLAEADRYVVLMGTPGATQKAVLAVRDGRDRILAYLKIGWQSTARNLVRHEADVLTRVEPGIAPSLIAKRENDLLSAVMVSALQGAPPSLQSAVPESLVRRAMGVGDVPVEEHPVVTALRSCSEDEVSGLLAGLSGLKFTVNVSHGDAAPWNARVDAAGRLRLFDWEYGNVEGMNCMDVAHWSLQVGHLSKRMSPVEACARACGEVSSRLGLSRAQAAGVCGLTAIEVANRLAGEGKLSESEWWRSGVRALTQISRCEGP